MNFNHLRYVITTAEEHNMTAAAKRLFISQPSLSQSIQKLEEELGTLLFDRSKTPLQLTPAGEIFVNWARQTIRMQQQTELRIQDLSDKGRIALTIGASAQRINALITPVIKEFYEIYPNCTIRFKELPASLLHDMLEKEEIDLMLGPNEPDSINYTSVLISDERPLLAVPASFDNNEKYDDATYPIIDLANFKDCDFLALSPDQTFGRYFRNCCSASGFIPKIIMECQMLSTMYGMVAEGLGIGLVTEAFAKRTKRPESVHYYKLSNMASSRQIFAVYNNDVYIPAALLSLIELMQNYANSLYIRHIE